MITLKAGRVLDPAFVNVVDTLRGQKFAFTTAYRLKRILDLVNQEARKLMQTRLDSLKKEGIIEQKDGEWKVVDEKRMLQFNIDFANVEIQIKRNPIEASLVGSAEVSMNDLRLLEGIIVNFEQLDEGEAHGEENKEKDS